MKLFEVVNPSDPITFEADDPDIAKLAALMLGRGRFGVTSEDGEEVLPLYIFGMSEEEAERVVAPLAEKGKTRDGKLALVAALDSFAVCSLSSRKALRAALGNDREALKRWNEEKRSSMNNICGAAAKLADSMRADLWNVEQPEVARGR